MSLTPWMWRQGGTLTIYPLSKKQRMPLKPCSHFLQQEDYSSFGTWEMLALEISKMPICPCGNPESFSPKRGIPYLIPPFTLTFVLVETPLLSPSEKKGRKRQTSLWKQGGRLDRIPPIGKPPNIVIVENSRILLGPGAQLRLGIDDHCAPKSLHRHLKHEKTIGEIKL